MTTVAETPPIQTEIDGERSQFTDALDAVTPEEAGGRRNIELGPKGKWSEGWAKVVPLGDGKIRFRVVPSLNQAQISFTDDIAPRGQDTQSKWLREMLEVGGFRYFAKDRVWGMQRGSDKYQSTSHAEEVFSNVANAMLGYAGLEPARSI